MAKRWATIRDGREADVHVTPINDVREHADSGDCWCQPRITRVDGVRARVIVHNAADGRELVERHGVN
jgi:hypothetical protein